MNLKNITRFVPSTLCLLTVALMLLVSLQSIRPVVPVQPLYGTFDDPVKPQLSYTDFCSGVWQAQVDKYLRQTHGFREPAIRLYNQYQWSLFGQSPVPQVVLGRNQYLFEPYVVEDYYESRMYKYTNSPEELLRRFDIESQRLAKIQAILAQYGTHLFVVCWPSKDHIYPQYLPSRGNLTRPKGPTAIDNYPPLFAQYGIPCINYCSYIEQRRDSLPYHFFPQMGTHWSTIAATYAFDSVMRYMRQNTSCLIPQVVLGNPYSDYTRYPDADLSQMMNLIRLPHPRREQYVDVHLAPGQSAIPRSQRPGLIVIGDSFFKNINLAFPLDSLFRYCHYWYYNSTIHYDSLYDNTNQIDLVAQLLDADIVMLAYCSGQLYDLGVNTLQSARNFTTQALVQLCFDTDRIQQTIDDICSRIRSDQSWFERLQRKAEQQSRTIDEVVVDDAEYLLFTQPEEFFPELALPGIPTSRSSRIANAIHQ